MNLNDTFSSLRSSHDDWKEILGNPSYYHKDHKISWYGRDEVCEFFPDPVRRSYVASQISHHQYTSKFVQDDSIIQMFYKFDNNNNNLIFAKLAYLNSGIGQDIIIEDFSILPETTGSVTELSPNYSDNDGFSSDDPIVPWIRIDHDPRVSSNPLHHVCHMHIGSFQHSRIPLSRVPTPRQFIEFIISLCYPDQYRSMRLDGDGKPIEIGKVCSFNEITFEKIDADVYSTLPHITIPKY